jgi:ATP-binding cassette subfamily B protein
MDRIYVMDGGRIVQEGRYEELVDVPGRFAEIFAMQTR